MAAVLVAGAIAPAPSAAVTTERLVADWHSGLAIMGFDPLSYFVDGQPQRGRPDLEYSFAGATWRFRNEGNRAAFIRSPERYMPRYGGYDPVGVARGAAVAGNPNLWIVADGQLCLFYSKAALDDFFGNAEQINARAEHMWPIVLRTLAP
jgi:hypothetical protein